MKRAIRSALAAMKSEAEVLGAEIAEVGYGGKHPWAIVEYQGETRRVLISGSPRNETFECRYARQRVRRAVREIEGC